MSVCENQDKFNTAINNALDNYRLKPTKITGCVAFLLLVFAVWALFLASKVENFDQKVTHVLLALIFGPLYVLSYYLAMLFGR
jgi:hypothetical protein